jgi:hypothetical protein
MRTVMNYPALRLPIAARRDGAQLVLYIGPPTDNQPWIEVIADHADPSNTEVFHGMMLRPGLMEALGLDAFVEPEYGPQRA